MKKVFLFVALLCACTIFTSCKSDEPQKEQFGILSISNTKSSPRMVTVNQFNGVDYKNGIVFHEYVQGHSTKAITLKPNKYRVLGVSDDFIPLIYETYVEVKDGQTTYVSILE